MVFIYEEFGLVGYTHRLLVVLFSSIRLGIQNNADEKDGVVNCVCFFRLAVMVIA